MCCVVSPCDMLSYVECVLYRIVSQYVVLHLLVVFLSLSMTCMCTHICVYIRMYIVMVCMFILYNYINYICYMRVYIM